VLAKNVRRKVWVQNLLHSIGIAIMISAYLLIIPFLSITNSSQDQSNAYTYLILAPFLFLIGLVLFILPSFWQGESAISRLVNSVLGLNLWNHL
jgi:membrane protein CcdC involved in cytochrome C biogenesis